MPLKVMDLVEQRLAILQEPALTGRSVREVCARAGISPDTFYPWRRRYDQGGLEALAPSSRRPQRSPGQLDPAVEDRILALRKEHGWGARKIRDQLARDGVNPLPVVSTVGQSLARRGVLPLRRARRRPRDEGTRFQRQHSNDMWQIDGTQHHLGDGSVFWVVDIVDDRSRFCVAALVGANLTGGLAWQAVRGAVSRHGLPAELLSDNGLCFTGRLHHLEVFFERQVTAAGITFHHSRPYNPRCCGKIERFHQTQNDWLARRPAPTSLATAQALLDGFAAHYNTQRPHQALDGATPAEVYQPGEPLQLPPSDLPPATAFPAGTRPRKVNASGVLGYRGRTITIGNRYAGVTVGLRHTGARLEVYYGHSLLDTYIVGTLDTNNN